MSFEELLAEKTRDLIRKNVSDVLKNESRLEARIKTNYRLVQKFSNITLDEYKEYVVAKIHENDLNTLIMYAKNPTRQNIHEPIQLQILEKHLGIKIKRFNKSSFPGTKTFDGISEDGKSIFQCKYVKECGGSQDNQIADLIKFNVPSDYENNYLVISGEYGIKRMRKYINENALCDNVKVVFLSNDIEIYDKRSQQKEHQKFFSTNENLISEEMIAEVKPDDVIIEPFVGNGDLLKNFDLKTQVVKTYDIETPVYTEFLFERKDTLKNNVLEEGCFVITNPPFLAKNKMSLETKEAYKEELTDVADLYQIFIKQLIETKVRGGVLILPSNFAFGKQARELFESFRECYYIKQLNIFETKTFEDTTQSIISLLFTRNRCETEALIHGKEVIDFSDKFDEIIEFDWKTYFPCKTSFKIKRFYELKNDEIPTHISVSLIDGKGEDIHAFWNSEPKEHKHTDRAYINIVLDKKTYEKIDEEKVIEIFNKTLKKLREETHSLVLTSYREFRRKRLTFEEAFHLIRYAIESSI